MKEIVISPKRLKKEITIFAICFVIGFIFNVYAVIRYQTPWHELFTQLGYVLLITISLYFVVVFIRFILYLIKNLIKVIRKNQHK